MKTFHGVLLIGLIFLPGCGGGGAGGESQSEQAQTDPCNNGLGNGDQIISGPPGPTGADFDQPFRSVAIDPGNPNIVFVGTEKNGICKSTDGGTTWDRLRYGLWHGADGYSEAWDIAIHPQGSATGLFLAMTGGPLPITSPNANAGVYRSTDGGATWVRKNCGISNHKTNSVIYDPNNPNVLILGVEGGFPSGTEAAGQYQDGGLYRSTDGGANWNLISLPTYANKQGYWHLRARGSAPTTFYTFAFNYIQLSENLGFLRSTNGGQTWSQFAPSLQTKFIVGFDVSADQQTIFAIERDAFTAYKSTDGGTNWTSMGTNGNGPIRVSPANVNLVLFADATNKLYRSTDGLSSSPQEFTLDDQVQDIEFAPSNPSIVYVATRGYRIYKSLDAGGSWTKIKNLRAEVLNQ